MIVQRGEAGEEKNDRNVQKKKKKMSNQSKTKTMIIGTYTNHALKTYDTK